MKRIIFQEWNNHSAYFIPGDVRNQSGNVGHVQNIYRNDGSVSLSKLQL